MLTPWALVVVAVGGALGTVARFAVGSTLTGGGLAWGIVAVNATGSLALGYLTAVEVQHGTLGGDWWLLAGVGFLGAYTTMSTFAVDTFVLLSEGAWGRAAANVLLNPVLAVAGAFAGWTAAGGA